MDCLPPSAANDDDDEEDEEPTYVVEKILDKTVRKGHSYYLVKWAGYADTSWEPAANLRCENLLEEYEEGKRVHELQKKSKLKESLKSLVEKKAQAQIAAEKRRYGLNSVDPDEEEKNERCKRELAARLAGKPSTSFRIKKLDPNSDGAKSTNADKACNDNIRTGGAIKENPVNKENGLKSCDLTAEVLPSSTVTKETNCNTMITKVDKSDRKAIINNPVALVETKPKLPDVLIATETTKTASSSNSKKSVSSSDSSSGSDSSSSDSSNSSSPLPASSGIKKRKLEDPVKALIPACTSGKNSADAMPEKSKLPAMDVNAGNSCLINLAPVSVTIDACTGPPLTVSSAVILNSVPLSVEHSESAKHAPHANLSFETNLAVGWSVEKVLGIFACRKQKNGDAVICADENASNTKIPRAEEPTDTEEQIVKLKIRTASGNKRTECVSVVELQTLAEDSPVLKMVVKYFVRKAICG